MNLHVVITKANIKSNLIAIMTESSRIPERPMSFSVEASSFIGQLEGYRTCDKLRLAPFAASNRAQVH